LALRPYHHECGMGDARHSTAFEKADRERMMELNRVLREHGTCRYCKNRLNENTMQRSPGCCGLCRRRGHR
jgi:hypothetical protein